MISRTTLIALSLWVSVLTAPAFLPGPDIIRACPHCEQKIRQSTMRSGNTYHGRHWTDGKAAYPWYPDWPAFAECPKCNGVFWIRDTPVLEEAAPDGQISEEAQTPKFPSVKKVYQYLDENDLDRGKELYLRQRLWWMANERWRTGREPIRVPSSSGTNRLEQSTGSPAARNPGPPPRKAGFTRQERINLERFRQLLGQDERDSSIMLAEIARELGEFDRCVQMLENAEGEVAAVIRSLANHQDARVREIQFDE